MPKIINKKVKITANYKVAPGHYKMIIQAPQVAGSARPGQFIEVKVDNSYKPLLRKPFSIHRVGRGRIELLYEVAGEGTKILSARKPGSDLDIIGPLGNGFNYSFDSRPLLIAGGMGVAPLLFLAERLKQGRVTVLIGARERSRLVCKKDFQKLGCEVKISTDDGSAGRKGKVTDLLKDILSTAPACRQAGMALYACGPDPMLKEIVRIAKRKGIFAQVSLEAYMACGLGVCLGCAVETASGYKLVCKDGPVFEAKDLF